MKICKLPAPREDARLTVLAREIKEKLTLARRHGQATLSVLMDAGDRFDHARRRRDRPTKLRRLAQSWESYDYGNRASRM